MVLATLLLLVSLDARAQERGRSVRVRIFSGERLASATLRAEGGKMLLTEYGSLLALHEIGPGEPVKISVENGQVTAALPSGPTRFRKLRVAPAPGCTVHVTRPGAAKDGRTYTGFLNVEADPKSPARLRLINEVGVEDYVASVLPKEYPFDDEEGAKALAVVIRTYALQPSGKYGPDFDHTDDVGSQVYVGAGAVTPLSREAARTTEGEVLTHRGSPIQATHYSSSGGYTASNEDVWPGAPVAYLRSRPDPHDASPHRNWTFSVDKGKLLNALSGAYGKGKRVTGFAPGPRGADGRVRNVAVVFADDTKRSVLSNDFRMVLSRSFGARSLRSTNFSVRAEGAQYVFQGKGFGHGVGLSQWGAHQMALGGRSYRDILSFYYTGVVLEKQGATVPAPSPIIRQASRKL